PMYSRYFLSCVLLLMLPRSPGTTRFPYTTLFRSSDDCCGPHPVEGLRSGVAHRLLLVLRGRKERGYGLGVIELARRGSRRCPHRRIRAAHTPDDRADRAGIAEQAGGADHTRRGLAVGE